MLVFTNQKKRLSIVWVFICLILSLFLLSSCATKIESVEDRATARWEALIASDYEKAYLFETPSYRKTYSFRRYLGNYGGEVKWTSVKVDGAKEINETLSDISLLVKVKFEGMPMEITSKERWILKDKQWWHVQD